MGDALVAAVDQLGVGRQLLNGLVWSVIVVGLVPVFLMVVHVIMDRRAARRRRRRECRARRLHPTAIDSRGELDWADEDGDA